MNGRNHLLIDLDGVLVASKQWRVQLTLAEGLFLNLKKRWPAHRSLLILAETARSLRIQLHQPTGLTNFEKMARAFSAVSGLSHDEASHYLESVLLDSFKNTQHWFSPLQAGIDFLRAVQGSFKISLLTNPVLTKECLDLKLRWAGLDDFAFQWMTHAQNSYSIKPHLSYFRESLQGLGVSPARCCLVGDREDREGPARELGIEVFIVGADPELFWKELNTTLATRFP